MTAATQTASKTVEALRKAALQFPEAEEGTSCMKAAFKARNKAFLFVGTDDNSCNVMVKLRESLVEAEKLAAKEPDTYRVGGHGWVTAVFRHDQRPPQGVLERWIDESYRLLVPKQLVALLTERSPKTAKKIAKKTRQKKTATR